VGQAIVCDGVTSTDCLSRGAVASIACAIAAADGQFLAKQGDCAGGWGPRTIRQSLLGAVANITRTFIATCGVRLFATRASWLFTLRT